MTKEDKRIAKIKSVIKNRDFVAGLEQCDGQITKVVRRLKRVLRHHPSLSNELVEALELSCTALTLLLRSRNTEKDFYFNAYSRVSKLESVISDLFAEFVEATGKRPQTELPYGFDYLDDLYGFSKT